MATQYSVPSTPRVISPSPTPSENTPSTQRDGYFGPVTRSAARRQVTSPPPPPISEDEVAAPHNDSPESSDPELRARARSRSRDPDGSLRRRRMSGLTSGKPGKKKGAVEKLEINGHLAPESAEKKYWREVSRSPSPLGLIPIHKEWRTFIHKHEIPRKVLHTSIGGLTTFLYITGAQPAEIHNILLAALIPIAAADFVRHRYVRLNRLYIRCLGALMRESEVDGWNGVIFYLLGAWIVVRWFPKDVGVMSVLLLSWCDTAASTFGRLWGRYTPRVRKGKSLAGTLAALLTGIATAVYFWGWVAPNFCQDCNTGENTFQFLQKLTLPASVRGVLGWSEADSTITGGFALGIMGVVAGVIASASEAVDIFGWDDNLTIPVLCGVGIWGFLRVFG